MPSFACVVLVDPRGWLLLQERDEHAPIDPECWGMSGGHLDDTDNGLEDPETAAYRELEEETGIVLPPGTLRLHRTFTIFHEVYGTHDPVHVYVAGVDLTDADVTCHEGRRIVFVDPATALDLPLTHSATAALPTIVGTDLHAELRWRAHGVTSYACAAVLDRRGWLLLQERDEHAPVAPECWSLPGGGRDAGETYADAARRELAEETGVDLDPDDLELLGSYEIEASADGPAAAFEVWAAATDLTDADVACHEGRQMVFVDPATIPGLPLARATARMLPDLLRSALYRKVSP